MEANDDDISGILVMYEVFGSLLSLCGSVFVLTIYFKYQQLQDFAFTMIACLSFSDFLMSFGKILTIFRLDTMYQEDSLCLIQAILINFGGLASILWTACISYALRYYTVFADIQVETSYQEKFRMFGFGIPFVASLIPLLTGSFGIAGRFCWIRMTPDDLWSATLGLFEFYIPLWITFGYNYYSYKKTIEYLSTTLGNQIQRELASKLVIYPKILVFCWFFATLDRIWSIFFGPNTFLSALHALFGPWQGFLNAIIYGLTNSVKSTLGITGSLPCLEIQPALSPQLTEQEQMLVQLNDLRILASPMPSRDVSLDPRRRKSDAEVQEMFKLAAAYEN